MYVCVHRCIHVFMLFGGAHGYASMGNIQIYDLSYVTKSREILYHQSQAVLEFEGNAVHSKVVRLS